MVKLLTAVKVF